MWLTPEHNDAIEAASLLGDGLDAVQGLVDQARVQEREQIATYIQNKAQSAPLASRLIYYLLARDIRGGAHAK